MSARLTIAILLALLLFPRAGFSHDLPVSYLDLRATETGVAATVESSAQNYARELTGLEDEALLLQPEEQRERLGPDHILFVIGLLLLGGTLGQLLKIVTAFTAPRAPRGESRDRQLLRRHLRRLVLVCAAFVSPPVNSFIR